VRRASFRPGIVLVVALTLVAGACHSGSHGATATSGSNDTKTSSTAGATTTTIPAALGPAIVLSAQGSELDAYSTERPPATQTVVPSPAADHDGVDVSGQICFDPTSPRQFVAVDRTAAADGQVGWGVFTLSGHALGKLSARETARLVPTFQPSSDAPSPFGCGFLPDGRLLTTDVGNRTGGPSDGQLIEWFPPFDRDTVVSCKVDVTLAGPEGVLVDGDHVLVAESRDGGVAGFVSSTLPTSNRPTGGCAGHDVDGAALAIGVVHSGWLQNAAAARLTRPATIARAGDNTFYVSSPSTGVIAQVDANGRFVRRVLAPPPGALIGRHPFVTGSPVGLGVAPNGTLYYSDSGLVALGSALVAGVRTGTIRRIVFTAGKPQPPEVVSTGLEAPDGIGVWLPSA
jgi:hypothetical protein